MAEYWEKVQHTSARPHVDLVPGKNETGMHLMRADSKEHAQEFGFSLASMAFLTFL